MTALVCANIRTRLRAHTDDIHRRLETVPAMQRLLCGTLTLHEYTEVLQAYRRFYTAAQPHLECGYRELHAIGLHMPPKDALALLTADLVDIDAAQDLRDDLPTPPVDAYRSVGWVWVVEGSVLGGVVIDRALQALFGERREGRRFFQTQPDMAMRWQRVCAAIEAYAERDGAPEAMIDGAADAFGCVERSLREMRA